MIKVTVFIIYYVRGVIQDGKVHIVSETRFVQNPKPEDIEEGFVWTYHMSGGNDPCLKIKKQYVAICVRPENDEFKSKTYDFRGAEFRRLFLHEDNTAESIDSFTQVS